MDQDFMTSGWYFAKGGAAAGNETGPFEWDQLYQLARNGTIEPDDLVWNPKLPRGVAARLVPGLFQGLETTQAQVQQVWLDQVAEPPIPEPYLQAADADKTTPQPPQSVEVQAEMPVLDDVGDSASDEERLEEPAQQSSKRSRQAKSDKQSNRLPLLVVLLTFIIAVAGVSAYFLYFRV